MTRHSALPPEWAPKIDLATAKEIQRLAEIQMEDAVSIAISGDARAATLAAAMSAISAALLAAAVTILGIASHNLISVVALLVSSAAFMFAAGLAIVSAKPVDFHLREYHPYSLMMREEDELQLVKWATADLGRKLEHNRAVQVRAGRFMTASYWTMAVGIVLPLAAIVFYLFGGFCTFG